MLTLMTKINTQFKSTVMTGLIIILVLALAAVGVLVVMLLRARENGARMQEQVRILGEEQRRLKADRTHAWCLRMWLSSCSRSRVVPCVSRTMCVWARS